MRRSLSTSSGSGSALAASTGALAAASSNPSTPTSNNNSNLDNASAKKRWLRQAISEETDNPTNPRPMSPDCVAPLKKRRFARSSISSEVSNTPPLTPNHLEGQNSEHDEHDSENDLEAHPVTSEREDSVI